MNQTKFLELISKSDTFSSEDWIDFEAFTQLIENNTDPSVFKEKLIASIRTCDEIFIAKENQKNNTEDLNAFAKGNKEAVEAILKQYEQEVDVLEVFLNATFYEFALLKSKLNLDAAPFKPSSPGLNASAPSWTPNAEAEPFVFSAKAPEWTPSTSLSVEVPEFKPSFSIDAPEFVPSFSSKPVGMPSAYRITEGNANDNCFNYDSFFDDSQESPISFSTIAAPPPEQKPKVYICDVEKTTYSVDWLLQVRLETKFINPAPEIPADVAHPLHRRSEIWTENQFNPYKFESNEDEFGFENLGKFVTPVFQDEINYEEVCDTFSGTYGINVLKRMQPCYRDIHPALIDKPEILNKDTINNIIMQFMAVGGMNPLFQLSGGLVPGGFPGMFSPNMEIPPHVLHSLPPTTVQNFMVLKAMVQHGAGKTSWLDDDPVKVETTPKEESSSSEDASKETETKEKTPPPAPPTPKKKKGSSTPRSKSNKKKKRVKTPRFSKDALKTPEKKAQPKLHKAKHVWSRRGVVEKEEDLAARMMQSILNKLVPEKFERLLKQALDPKSFVVTKKSTLLSLTEKLHKKSMSEADYAPLYTHFVHKLKKAKFKSFTENGEETDIETVLLDLCLKRLNAEVKVEESDEEKEMKMNKFRKETLGNYTLLGELYKREVLEHEKLSSIVLTLVGIVVNPEEDHDIRARRVEQVFHLLKSCGTEFEEECKERNHFRDDEPHILDKHFVEIAKAAEDESLKPRVRFMLQDLVELKNKHWESRNNGGMDPKFLSEIREDIRKEQICKKQFLYKLRRRQNSTRERSSKRRSQTPRASTRSSKRRGNPSPRESPRQRRCLKPLSKSLSDSNVLLQKKNTDSTTIPIEKSKRSPKIDKIKWAKIVQGHMEEDLAQTPVAQSIPVAKPPTVNAWAKGPPINLTKASNENFETKTNISSDPSDTLSQPSESTASECELDDLIIQKKLLEFFEEEENFKLSSLADILEGGVSPEQLVVTSLNLTIEKQEKHREMLGSLFVQLLTGDLLIIDDVVNGFKKASQYFDDWELDVPKLPEFVRSWLDLLSKKQLCKPSDFSFLADRYIVHKPLETRI